LGILSLTRDTACRNFAIYGKLTLKSPRGGIRRNINPGLNRNRAALLNKGLEEGTDNRLKCL
jgi:hypothetical protein